MNSDRRLDHTRVGELARLEHEQVTWLALLPLTATLGFYLLPLSARQVTLVQFIPQLVAYASFVYWAQLNGRAAERLGLTRGKLRQGLRWGTGVGLLLGVVNAGVILWVVPRLGRDITFLRNTPHAQIPQWIMLPWVIGAIAVFVEVNFRGFQLGRLRILAQSLCPPQGKEVGALLAIVASAVAFAFDPFLVATFKYLHWIALWDGLIWGGLWIRQRNLYTTIVAHGLEVVILYTLVRTWLEH